MSLIVAGLGQCSLDYLTFVDAFPVEDKKCEVSPWVIEGGGPVATALVVLSRLGVKTRFAGVTGDDEVGVRIKNGLISEGVDISHMLTEKGGFSQTACIIINRTTASRTILWSRASRDDCNIAESFLNGATILHLDGLMQEASINAAQMARSLDVPVMLDAGSVRSKTHELLPLCDYVVCSEEFSKKYASSHEETLLRLTGLGVRFVCVTLGSDGSLAMAPNGHIFHHPAYDIEVVDTTGAGDVFHGGCIYGILNGWPHEKTIRFATAIAAMKCLRMGGRAGIPRTLEEINGFMFTTPLKHG
ncbi:PfkB family carbohydrate kinase [Candidatus Magnetominusculus dajiuhuensis]|uniref:PfkB family carbohydrate kinase n=1 Tax=Candidatus Magnetominusculus dajiuhuensis TaxID=3137712 RepID=UPI003B43520D